ALQRWGRIDYLILYAGVAVRDFAQNTSEETGRMVMDTNYFGPVELAKEVLPYMEKNGGGHIVVISSLSGKYGVPKLSSYSASKHALHGFFQSMRAEVAAISIKISFIIPGFINTPILKNAPDGNGNVNGKNLSVNENGMSPQLCAKKILKAVGKGKEEALIGRKEILSVYVNRFFPKIFSVVIRNHPVRKMKMIMKLI
ncbi:MAG: SDR family NAD(P)-dependent oxidoreductase, partial [Bacteroidia bacterium]|nr:SDR family NAD(P)-dependent oxidoreductase [Bacteroidia bacterium]